MKIFVKFWAENFEDEREAIIKFAPGIREAKTTAERSLPSRRNLLHIPRKNAFIDRFLFALYSIGIPTLMCCDYVN
jgi:hypothetical protein